LSSTKTITNRQMVKRLLGYLKPHRKKFFVAVAAMAVYGMTDGVIPFLLKNILDKIFGEQDLSMLYVIPALLVGFAVLRAGFGFAQQYLSASVGLSIVEDIRNDINRKLLDLSPSFYNASRAGNLISRMTNDTLLVRTALTDASAALLRDSIRICALVFAAIWLDPVLGTIALFIFPLAIYPIIRFGKKVRKHSRVGQDQFGGLTSNLGETIAGYKVIQSFNLQEMIQKRFLQENSVLTRTLKKAERYGALSGPTNEVFSSLAIAAIIIYGGSSVISGSRTQGQFVAFLVALFLMYDPAKKLGKINNTIQTGFSAAERIFELLDEEIEISEKENARTLQLAGSKGEGSIKFEDLSFSYSEPGEPVLSGISLEVPHGKTLALVGPSGGGKSTLVSMLPRYYDPVRGRVLIAGEDIREVSLKSLRDAVSVVDQHTFLFNDTIAANIGFGDVSANMDKIRSAAKAASALGFIEELPEGFDTVIGEQGLRLSGGQRARIAIARALIKDSPILVLDEATAALDSESEQYVQEAIENLMEGRTVVVIAHRLATVRSADQIAVIDKGKVAELGTHEELLSQDGIYTKLHSMQFGSESEEQKSEALGNQ